MAFLTDSSPSAHVMTLVGNGSASAAQVKFGTGAYLNGAAATSAITSPSSPDWQFGNGMFTIEAWGYLTSHNTANLETLVSQWGVNFGWWFGLYNGNLTFFYSTTGGDNPSITAAYTPPLNQYIHLVACRDATSLRLFADGVLLGTTTFNANIFASTATLQIGNDGSGAGRLWPGYVDCLRIEKGAAIYTSAFTPPAAPLAADSNTVLLMQFDGVILRGARAGNNQGGNTDILNLPTGIQVGDLTLVYGSWTNATAGPMALPAGWTVLAQGVTWIVGYRVYQAGDPTSITVTGTTGGSNYNCTSAISYSGCDPVNPIDTFATCMFSDGAFQNRIRAPSIDPLYNSDTLVCAFIETQTSTAGGTLTLAGGLTSRLVNAPGPCIALADKSLVDGSPTGNFDSTWDNRPFQLGVAVALRQLGASSAAYVAPQPTTVAKGIYTTGAAAVQVTLDFSQYALQPGDLVMVGMSHTSAITPPAGYTAAQSSGNGSVFTHTWAAGDNLTPTFTFAAGYTTAVVYVLRRTGPGSNPVTIDTSGQGNGTGTATIPMQGINGNSDHFTAFFFQSSSTGGTWTPPGGLTVDQNYAIGPNMLVAYSTGNAAGTIGPFTATNTLNQPMTGVGLATQVVPGGGSGATLPNFLHSLVQAKVRSITGTSLTFEGDFHALFDSKWGPDKLTFAGRLVYYYLNFISGANPNISPASVLNLMLLNPSIIV